MKGHTKPVTCGDKEADRETWNSVFILLRWLGRNWVGMSPIASKVKTHILQFVVGSFVIWL